MKILNFGSCNIDYVYSLDHIVEAGETETTHSLSIFPGGKGLNQSIAAARAGASVYHAGCIGKDGDMLKKILQDSGVDTTFLRTVDEKNGHAIIQVTLEGENSIFLYPGSNEMISNDFVDEVFENFEKDDIILLQNEINNVDYIIKKAYQKEMFVILNPSPFNEKMRSIDLTMISCLILNEIEARDISGCGEPEASLKYFRENYPEMRVMLTLGKSGCIYQDKQRKIYHPAFKVKAVDTTAAGDTFTGYFASELSNKTPYEQILKIASCASAIAVSRNGAAPSIPLKEEVIKKQKELTTNNASNKDEIMKRQIEKYIKENIKDCQLDTLSKILGYSNSYTGLLVKKLMGKSFSELIKEERCTQAAKMLRETDIAIGEIIRVVGYENESFFRGNFKDIYEKSPLEYRKSYQKKDRA